MRHTHTKIYSTKDTHTFVAYKWQNKQKKVNKIFIDHRAADLTDDVDDG